jgi:hypothetical protein
MRATPTFACSPTGNVPHVDPVNPAFAVLRRRSTTHEPSPASLPILAPASVPIPVGVEATMRPLTHYPYPVGAATAAAVLWSATGLGLT